ncbi:hypothetical protein TrVFT333_009394 [Trichoderma virens FT-333]|nr:hypothetical protein TrVFT333_009394 [Trichoderma virens FT-333]
MNGETNGQVNGHTNGHTNGVKLNGDLGHDHHDLDAVIVGAGFAGVYLLYQLRKEGYKAKIVEAGTALGGVWHWNSYPGARTDTPISTYCLNIPEVYNTWTWSEEYASDQEIKAYFQHIDKVCDISKDTIYSERITKATFDQATDKWQIELEPSWPGMRDVYNGKIITPDDWPAGLDLTGKKVAIVGTGATGVQIAQEAPPALSSGEFRFTTVGGFLFEETSRCVMDDTPEQQEAVLQEMYDYGGFRVFFQGYIDVLGTQEGNDVIYNFWRRKTHERMTDKKKAELLAPLKPPHPFAGKRTSLETGYYEQMDKPHVTLVDAKKFPVVEVAANGLVTSDGKLHEADYIILATGYDAVTGGFREIEMTGLDGITLEEKWKDSTTSYLGLMVSGFPNMFYAYGPLSPTAYATGPAVVESQTHWMLDVMRKMKEKGATRVDATVDAEQKWREKINMIHAWTLREKVEGSWYLGLNVPGKRRETLIWAGGLPMYRKEIWDAIEPELKGFTLS